jgi:hypothetical protein
MECLVIVAALVALAPAVHAAGASVAPDAVVRAIYAADLTGTGV